MRTLVGGRGGGDRRRVGFTVVELAVAMVLVVFGVLAALSSQLTSLDLLHTTREGNTATADLQAAMEQALLLPIDQMPVPGSPFEANVPVAAFSDLHLAGERIVATYPGYAVGGAVPDPLEIVLTLTWTDWKGRARRQTLGSMKTR